MAIGCALLFAVSAISPVAVAESANVDAPFPSKPIKIVVYMKPGGLIDATARRFVGVASKYARDATFVVENKHGAGGVVAMQKVRRQEADGYTLLACTKSNISKVVSCNVESYLEDFHWLAFLMSDPECVITRRGSHIRTWPQLVKDAQAHPGQQLWLGPENGGLDHVTALKIWEAAGITAKWIPCASGGEARGKLQLNQGIAYVGNPGETLERPDLFVAAVCSRERLPQFPDTPTFDELGIKGVGSETMWRGIAIKRESPPAAIAWYEVLFRKVSADPDWKSFWEKGGIDVTFQPHETFSKIVEQDRQDFRLYLTKLGLVHDSSRANLWSLSPWNSFAITMVSVCFLGVAGQRVPLSVRIIVGVVTGFALVCLSQTFTFPIADSVGPGTIPRIYVTAIVLIAAVVIVGKSDVAIANEYPEFRVAEFIATLIAYWFALCLLGYIVATALFLCVVLFRMGVRQPLTIGSVTACWIAISYFVFVKALFVPLPTGILWGSL